MKQEVSVLLKQATATQLDSLVETTLTGTGLPRVSATAEDFQTTPLIQMILLEREFLTSSEDSVATRTRDSTGHQESARTDLL